MSVRFLRRFWMANMACAWARVVTMSSPVLRVFCCKGKKRGHFVNINIALPSFFLIAGNFGKGHVVMFIIFDSPKLKTGHSGN